MTSASGKQPHPSATELQREYEASIRRRDLGRGSSRRNTGGIIGGQTDDADLARMNERYAVTKIGGKTGNGPLLRGEPGTPEFVASYNEAVARKTMPPKGTLLSLLRQYQASEDFTGLARSTRRSYVALIVRIEKSFADFPLAALTDRRTRGVFKAWRDNIAAESGRRQADYAWTVLARVMSWGLDRGIATANPCERGGRLYRASRADKIWTTADEAAFLANAPAHLHLPLLLALWTGQRQGDLLRLPWSACDGKYIRLRQSKTGRFVQILVGAPLRAMLDATPRQLS
jgi:hypothetical protein